MSRELPKNPIIIGCNYHTKWQSKKGMRFVLKEVKGNKARLITRNTNKDFWTDLSDIIFIRSDCNVGKAFKLIKKNPSLLITGEVNA